MSEQHNKPPAPADSQKTVSYGQPRENSTAAKQEFAAGIVQAMRQAHNEWLERQKNK